MPNGMIAGAKRAIGQFVVAVVRDWCLKDIIHVGQGITNQRLRLEFQTCGVLGKRLDMDVLVKSLVAHKNDITQQAMVDQFWYFICQCVYGEKGWNDTMPSSDDITMDGKLFRKENHRWVLNRAFFEEKNISFDTFVKFFEKCVEEPDKTFPSYLRSRGFSEALWIYDLPNYGNLEFDDGVKVKKEKM